MKSTEADIRFPAIGITTDEAMWGFDVLDVLTACGHRTLKEHYQSGMELIDSDGRRWVVRSFRRIGRNRPLLIWLFFRIVQCRPTWRIEQELEPLPPVTLNDIKERACAYVDSRPDEHCCDGNHREDDKCLLTRVRAAKDIREVYDALGLGWFSG